MKHQNEQQIIGNRHCYNRHCNNRDICLWASQWRPEKPIFFGDERDCTDFVRKTLEQKNSETSG